MAKGFAGGISSICIDTIHSKWKAYLIHQVSMSLSCKFEVQHLSDDQSKFLMRWNCVSPKMDTGAINIELQLVCIRQTAQT